MITLLSFFHPDPISSERGQTFEPSAVKMQAAATIATAACRSPQNAINVGPAFQSRKWKPHRLPGWLDWISSIKPRVIIAHVIDSATDWPRH